jgi:hypothetical protein
VTDEAVGTAGRFFVAFATASAGYSKSSSLPAKVTAASKHARRGNAAIAIVRKNGA